MNAILESYVECALWSSSGTVSEEDLKLPTFAGCEIGDDYSFDDHFGEDDLAPATLEAMTADIAELLAFCAAENISHGDWDDEQLGHDFWLTRNGHGAGFWDRGLENGDALTEAAKTFGSVYLYVGDDGLVYC